MMLHSMGKVEVDLKYWPQIAGVISSGMILTMVENFLVIL